jgi:nicotinate-nucleotide pyrophosphorylase (carboxylating)
MSLSQDVDHLIRRTVEECIREDLDADGDITTKALFGTSKPVTASIISKDHGILSGIYLVEPIFTTLDPAITITPHCVEGSTLAPQTAICTLEGCLYAILAGERIALNFMQHLSGVATHTARLSHKIAHTGAVLLDTRKTTPNLRLLEKKAVAAGGGRNHRMGLFDMILIKRNHIALAGGIEPALQSAHSWKQDTGKNVAIEIEVCSFDDFRLACAHGPDYIMLDNMSVEVMHRCVRYRDEQKPGIKLEASGKVTEHNIVSFAETGVDFISCGSITHSTRSLDIHLKTT